MNEFKINDIGDDEIRIVTGAVSPSTKTSKVNKLPFYRSTSFIVGIIMLLVILLIACFLMLHRNTQLNLLQKEPSYFEPVNESQPIVADTISKLSKWHGDDNVQSFCELRDTTINDVPLQVFIPHNALMSLHIGRMDKNDTTIIYTAQAADIRADNGGIVGAFVLKGVPRAWGLSKKGYCASIDGVVTVGVAENSPLFEEATEKSGYFFRQYALVDNGHLVENNPKGKTIRRAICDRRGEIFMVETGTPESLHDFAQALVDLGVDNAIYLVGSHAYGWAVDEAGIRHEFGDDSYYAGRRRMPRNISYIVWRKK